MKNKLTKLFAASCLLATGAANADVIVLDFEGVGDQVAILDFYNGGTDGAGNSGVDYDISFGTNTLGIIDSDAGGSGNFANEPTADTIMFFLTGTAVLNYNLGFDTGFSFFYSSATAADVVVYDDVDATGNVLATISLSAQHTDSCVGDPTGTFCNWSAVGASFDGIAKSIDFGGTVNQVGYDNITFGAADPVIETPTPAALGLVLLGLGFMARKSIKR